MSRQGMPWPALLVLAAGWTPAVARAEVYSYVDRQGTVHFTNLAPQRAPGRCAAGAAAAAGKAYLCQDDDGKLLAMHRVDVTTFDTLVVAAARYYTLPPSLVKAVVAVESNFDPLARSPAGALGLMQLLPQTAEAMHVVNQFDPSDNVYGGTRYLRVLANQFAGDLRLTLAAYNAGPEAVARTGGVPDIPATRAYVRRVLTLYRHYLSTWKEP